MMADPFSATRGGLKPHWNTLITELAAHLDARAAKVALIPEVVGNQLITSFAGDAVRRARRNRGNPIPVVPLQVLGRDWEVWLGYREVWTLLDRVEKFVFSSADLTVFFAVGQSEDFQQILRAEWVGPSKDLDDCWSFKPNNAGHPHWQIDAIEVVKEDRNLIAARQLLIETEPREFGEPEPASIRFPPWYEIARMHLASGMRPWFDDLIAHGPSELAAVRAWVVKTVGLLNIELARLP
jgi:hypothetical protein